jgi:UDP-glucose 4-epimerase
MKRRDTCNLVLVTGATGFVGADVCARLAADGMPVRRVVREHHHGPVQSDDVRIRGIDGQTDWSDALRGCGAVVHLAARVHVMSDASADPLVEYRAVNTVGTLNLARQAAAAGIKRFVFMSSVKVNGEGRALPYSLDDTPAPQDPYGVSKLEAESGLREIAASTGMEVVIIRPPLVYGPGVGANFLRLMRAVGKGVPLPFGRVRNLRSLIYVGNLVDLVTVCLDHPNAANRTYLASDGVDLATPDLIRAIAVAIGRPARLVPIPVVWLRAAGALTGKHAQVSRLLGSLTVDGSRLRDELGWIPPFTFQAGIKTTVEWYRSRTMNESR